MPQPAARQGDPVVGTDTRNLPPHLPPPGTSFSKPADAPTSSITAGSPDVTVA
jgi:hypothetical protein